MEKYNLCDLYYGVVYQCDTEIKKKYKTILLKLNDKHYYDFKFKTIALKTNNLNIKDNIVCHLKKVSNLEEIQISKKNIMKKIKTR